MLDTYEPDDCCGKRLAKALLAATAPLSEWTCPKCGTEWKPHTNQITGWRFRHWIPEAPVVVFRP